MMRERIAHMMKGGFTMLLVHDVPSYASYPNANPSSQLASAFEGIVVDDDAPDDVRRSAVNMFISMFDLLEKTGWYDHTSDWDFHIGLELVDGRSVNHIGDGASIVWAAEAKSLVYAGEDTRDLVHITTPRLEPDDEFPDPYTALAEYSSGDAEEELWAIPVSMIRSLTFGYCT